MVGNIGEEQDSSLMTETRSRSRVRELAMNYQASMRSVSNPIPPTYDRSHDSSLVLGVNRKPTANYSIMPPTRSSTSNATIYGPGTQSGNRSVSLNNAVPNGITASFRASPTPISTGSSNFVQSSALTGSNTVQIGTMTTGSMTQGEVDAALRSCLDVMIDAVTNHGKRPFSALLLAPDNKTILLRHHSISHVQHAESELARLAVIQYAPQYLSTCTLVSTWEPCAMCAGTIYWAGIGKLLYAASEVKLRELTGAENEENLTMDLPCRTIFSAGQRRIEVIGPIDGWERKVVLESEKWWTQHATISPTTTRKGNSRANGLIDGRRDLSSHHQSRESIVVENPQESFDSAIGDDGEYQADLKVDWMI